MGVSETFSYRFGHFRWMSATIGFPGPPMLKGSPNLRKGSVIPEPLRIGLDLPGLILRSPKASRRRVFHRIQTVFQGSFSCSFCIVYVNPEEEFELCDHARSFHILHMPHGAQRYQARLLYLEMRRCAFTRDIFFLARHSNVRMLWGRVRCGLETT